jgi:hypothetical protein
VRRFNLAKEFIKLMLCRPIGFIFRLALKGLNRQFQHA